MAGPSSADQRRSGRGRVAPMPTAAAVKAEETLIHVLWINAGLSCDGDSVALTAATQPSIEEIALGALARAPADRGALAADRLRVRPERRRRRLPGVVLQGRPGRARAVRPGRRGIHPQRAAARRGLLVRVRQQPGHRAADDHQRVAGPAGAEGDRDRGGRHLRHVRRHPRHGRQPDRRDGRAGLPRLGVEVQGRHPDRLRAGLPDPARQPVRDARPTCSTWPPTRRR